MQAIDAMIVWTPNTDLYYGKPLRGSVAVTTIPEAPELRDHPMSVGACDHNWKETDDGGRIKLMQKYYSAIVHQDQIDPDILDLALNAVEEFRDHIFDRAKPKGAVSE